MKFPILLFYLLFASFSFANKTSATGNPKADVLLDSAKHYIFTDNVKAYHFVMELEKLGKRQQNKIALGYARLYIALFDQFNGDQESALKNYLEAKKLAAESKDKMVMLRILLALSNHYLNNSDFQNCIRTGHEGLKKALAIHDKEMASQFYNNLSLCHSYMGEYKSALDYNNKSIALKKESNDETSLANAYLNRGLIYSNMKDNDRCLEFYTKAEILYVKTLNFMALTQTYINIAWEYTDMQQFPTARKYLKKAMQSTQKTKDKMREAAVYNAFGYYYQQIGYKDSVTQVLHKGYELSMESRNHRNALVAAKELAAHYEGLKDFKNAYSFNVKASQLNDSIFNETKIKLAQSLNARFENQEKELTISNQEKQIAQNEKSIAQRNTWIILICSIVVIGIIVFYIVASRRRNIAKNKEEQKINNAIFESEQKERIRIARDLHDSIGQKLAVMKMLMPSTEGSKELVQISEFLDETAQEVRTISHNLIPEILNFGFLKALEDLTDKINSTEDIQVDLKTDEAMQSITLPKQIELSLYRIVQEITSNIVRHAQTNKIVIEINASPEMIQLNISDQGIGFDPDKITQSEGLGWKNIFARIKLINGEIKINSSKNTGSNFFINIPIA